MLISQIMAQNLHTVLADDTLDLLFKIFNKVSYHHLPVVDSENNLLGIISDRDVTRNLSPFINTSVERSSDRKLLKMTAGEIMTASPITVTQTSRIKTAAILLLENNISCLPVVDAEGKLEGLLTWKDILKFHLYA